MSRIEYERVEVKLNDGTLVLGKMHKVEGVPCPYASTYANRTQAARAAEKEHGEVIQRGRPFYVRLPAPEAELNGVLSETEAQYAARRMPMGVFEKPAPDHALRYEVRTVYGVDKFYPRNANAETICDIAGTKTLSVRDLANAVKLGFAIVCVPRQIELGGVA